MFIDSSENRLTLCTFVRYNRPTVQRRSYSSFDRIGLLNSDDSFNCMVVGSSVWVCETFNGLGERVMGCDGVTVVRSNHIQTPDNISQSLYQTCCMQAGYTTASAAVTITTKQWYTTGNVVLWEVAEFHINFVSRLDTSRILVTL